MASTVYQAADVTVTELAVTASSLLNQRHEQQDAFLLSGHLVAVADGVGGHAHGALASYTALQTLADTITSPCTLASFLTGVDKAHNAVVALADGSYRNPATTLVALTACDDGCCVQGVWSGDSRAWLVQENGTVSCLTEDHVHHQGGLTACLGDYGGGSVFRADTFTLRRRANLKVLLTTDGVHGPLGEKVDVGRTRAVHLAKLVKAGVASLVSEAARLGTDNTTAVLVDVDMWLAGVSPVRAPRKFPVRHARHSSQWSAWIVGVSAHGWGQNQQQADWSLARSLLYWLDTADNFDSAPAGLVTALKAANGSLEETVALLDQ